MQDSDHAFLAFGWRTQRFLIGLGVAVTANIIYVQGGIRTTVSTTPYLQWLQHYHWGLVALIMSTFAETGTPRKIGGRYILQGFGLTLIGQESAEVHSFAWGDPWFLESTLIGLGLLGILLIRITGKKGRKRR